MKRKQIASCLILLTFLFSSCLTEITKKPSYSAEVDPSMKARFSEAEQLYAKKLYDSALSSYRSYIQDFPHNSLTDEAHYKISKIHFLRSDWEAAVAESAVLAKKTPNEELRAKANHMASHAAYKSGDMALTRSYLNKVEAERLPTKMQLRHFSLDILSGEKKAIDPLVLDYSVLRMMDLYKESADRNLSQLEAMEVLPEKEITSRFQTWMNRDLKTSPSWMATYPRGYSKPYVEYKLGKTLAAQGKTEKAREALTQLVNGYPKHELVSQANELLASLGGALRSVPKGAMKVGVLLPLSGSSSSFGQAALRGIHCASGVLAACRGAETIPVELVVVDSATNPEAMVAQLDDLEKQNVAAVIGPLSGPLSEKAALRSVELKLPLLPITQKDNLAGLRETVFQMGYQAKSQVSHLVTEALKRGYKRFAVFSPSNSYGKEMSEIFVKEVAVQGGKILSKAFYPPNEDLTDSAHSLKINLTSFVGENEKPFDAIFVPDSYLNMPKIFGALQLVGLEGVALLGTNAWNDPQLPTNLNTVFPGSFFVDLFFLDDESPQTKNFVAAMKSALGRVPTTVEALGYDALNVLLQASRQAGSMKRDRIREALVSGSFQGATGLHGFGGASDIRPFFLSSGPEGIQKAP